LVKYIDCDDVVRVGVVKQVIPDPSDDNGMVSLVWAPPYSNHEWMKMERGQFRENQLIQGRVRPYRPDKGL
jgi:hypothetical protein